ncbi:MAG: hypothetical protein JW816_01830 [Candidatus Buchananbacteria bacterium]|nr:hypothetical protein [Candidatus Buchananbacteria bacterium]
MPEDWGDTQNQFKIDMYCSALSLLLLCLHDGFFETPPASKVLGLISRGELTPDALDVGFKEALTADHLAGMLGVERPGGRERINMATAFFVLLAGSGDHEIQGP